ncbi:MAG: SDR family oxidoreductase [Ktedonobacteraceae bacterium]|nr:SDR family oxidoreductase [Ktedonobacteraceae bacterium]
MNRFTDNVVLITGGGTGIGRATALAFAREGATVVLAGRRLQPGEQTVALLRQQGGQGRFVQTDVTQEAEVRALLEQIRTDYGRLDIAFNNAGVLGPVGSVIELREDDWDSTIAVNLKGTWLSMKYEIPQMLRQGRGVIVNMSSVIGARVASPHLAAYTAAKAGVLAVSRAAALEYSAAGIRIHVVSPGPVRAPMSQRADETEDERDRRVAASLPIGRIGDAEEVARAVLWLSSEEAALAVGQDLVLDGGVSLS